MAQGLRKSRFAPGEVFGQSSLLGSAEGLRAPRLRRGFCQQKRQSMLSSAAPWNHAWAVGVLAEEFVRFPTTNKYWGGVAVCEQARADLQEFVASNT